MLKKFLHLILFTALAIEVFVALSKTWWFFELFTHYAVYYAVLGTLFGFLALAQKHFKTALIWAAMVSMNLALFMPYLNAPQPATTEGSTPKILSQNFYYENTNIDQFVTLVQEENPDIIIVVEAGEFWKTAKEKLRRDYPYLHLSHITGVHGTLIASRIPGSFHEVPLGIQTGLVFTPDDLSYQVLGVHPDAPLTPSWAADRNAQFDEIARLAHTSNVPLIVMGDFNTTPWSPYFSQLLEDSGLVDARLGFGLVPTWQAHNPLFWLPIDHALVSPSLQVQDFKTTQSIDSDHLGILLTFSL